SRSVSWNGRRDETLSAPAVMFAHGCWAVARCDRSCRLVLAVATAIEGSVQCVRDRRSLRLQRSCLSGSQCWLLSFSPARMKGACLVSSSGGGDTFTSKCHCNDGDQYCIMGDLYPCTG